MNAFVTRLLAFAAAMPSLFDEENFNGQNQQDRILSGRGHDRREDARCQGHEDAHEACQGCQEGGQGQEEVLVSTKKIAVSEGDCFQGSPLVFWPV